jgi:hypothetical protein
VSRCEIYRQAWMSDGQFECYQMLSDLFFGPHHITGTVKEYGSGIAVNVRNFRGATYDYDGLTRAVIMAHDRAIRFEIEPSGPGMLRLVLHKRQREGRMYERHPTLEEAIALLRDAQEEAKP